MTAARTAARHAWIHFLRVRSCRDSNCMVIRAGSCIVRWTVRAEAEIQFRRAVDSRRSPPDACWIVGFRCPGGLSPTAVDHDSAAGARGDCRRVDREFVQADGLVRRGRPIHYVHDFSRCPEPPDNGVVGAGLPRFGEESTESLGWAELAVCYAQKRQSRTGLFATVAQLVEQRFRKPQVVGSSPTRGSTPRLRAPRIAPPPGDPGVAGPILWGWRRFPLRDRFRSRPERSPSHIGFDWVLAGGRCS